MLRGKHWGGMLNVQRIYNTLLNRDNLGIAFKLRPRGIITLIEIIRGIVGFGLIAGFMWILLQLANIGAL